MKISKLSEKAMIPGLLLFVLVSCEKQLDVPLDQEFLVEDVDYTITADMDLVLKGAYGQFYFLQWETFPVIAVRGDDVNSAGDQVPLWEIEEYRYDENAWLFNSIWLNLYGDMFSYNSAIDEILKYKEYANNPGLADQYIAEIKVMKGFEMFQMVRIWGSIFIPETPLATELYDLELSSPDESLQYISDMMDDAIPFLPAVHPNQRTNIPGGMTRYTAYAVKALANLEMKNWQEAANAAGEIISSGLYSLEPDYYHLFKIYGKLNDEIVLELQYSDYGQSSGEINFYNHWFFYPQNWKPAVQGAGGGWGFWEPTQKYIKFMLDRGEELRLETSVLFTQAGIDKIKSDPAYATLPVWISDTTRDGDSLRNYARADFASGKHYLPSIELTPGRTIPGSNKNFICIRYSEILLSYAEALTQGASGNAISADQAVNLVRSRAGLGTLIGVNLDDVLDEKFAELAMEWGIRFYDLVRHNRTSELDHGAGTYGPEDRYIPYPLQQQDLLPQLRGDE